VNPLDFWSDLASPRFRSGSIRKFGFKSQITFSWCFG